MSHLNDNKREEFRKYLERAGVLEAFTRVLTALYEEPERPEDALEYLRQNLCVVPDTREMDELNEKINHLSLENEQLKAKLAKCELPATDGTSK